MCSFDWTPSYSWIRNIKIFEPATWLVVDCYMAILNDQGTAPLWSSSITLALQRSLALLLHCTCTALALVSRSTEHASVVAFAVQETSNIVITSWSERLGRTLAQSSNKLCQASSAQTIGINRASLGIFCACFGRLSFLEGFLLANTLNHPDFVFVHDCKHVQHHMFKRSVLSAHGKTW